MILISDMVLLVNIKDIKIFRFLQNVPYITLIMIYVDYIMIYVENSK